MYKGFFKRFLDILVSLIALPFVLLAVIIMAPIIYFNDPGPVFYNATRRGKNGKSFKMFKFRSMYVNSPDLKNADGSTFNSDNDPRVTKVGRIMRKLSIDEIPQILNVLIGDMSYVGPRPTLVARPFEDIPLEDRKRYEVRPGITGYAQAYFRNSITQQEKFRQDAYYVEHLSFKMDIKVLIQTVKSVVKSENVFVSGDSAPDTEKKEQKRLLIIGASILQLPAIKKAKEMGLYVAVADFNPNAVGIPFVDEYFNVSTIDEEGIYSTAKEFKAQGIMTLATDMPMRALAYAAGKLGLPGIDYETAVKSTDKAAMIKAFEEKGVAHPWYYVVSHASELEPIADKITYPCISKPTDNSGSRGVMLINTAQELKESVEYSSSLGRKGSVIIEEYMQGPEVSVEVIVLKGIPHILQVTDKLTTGTPHFVEMGHSQPSRLGDEKVKAIKELAAAAVKAVGIENGPAHVEIILTEQGPKMVELGARMGGDCITTHLVPLSTGIDMVEATVKIALGEEPDIQPKLWKASAIRFIKAGQGTIKSISGVEEAKASEAVAEVALTKQIGEASGHISSSVDRLGYVIAQAETAEKAVECSEAALNKIKIAVE